MKFLTLVSSEGLFDREVHGEPTVHSWGMLRWISAVKHILVKLGCEVPAKPMNLSLFLFYDELDAIKLFHGCPFALPVSLDLFLHLHILILRVG